MMADLLEYFESRSRSLDDMESKMKRNSPLSTQYTSCIRFNGVPILPPVMTLKRKEEMQTYRRMAMKRENTRKSRHREQLVAKVQSIVAEVEEKRAQRASDSSASSPVGSDTSATRLSPGQQRIGFSRSSPSQSDTSQHHARSSKTFQKTTHSSASSKISHTSSDASKARVPPGGLSSDSASKQSDKIMTKPSDKTSAKPSDKTSTKPSDKTGTKTIKKQPQQSKQSHLSVASKIKSKSEQDISKMGESEWTVVEQKSGLKSKASKMKSDKSGENAVGKSESFQGQDSEKKSKQSSTLNNMKRASSMSSLPNPAKIQGIPVPKPPPSPKSKQQQRRAQLGMSGQFSVSNPDLRSIDKSDSENSRSEDSPKHKREQLLKSSKHSVSDPDIAHAGLDSKQTRLNNEYKTTKLPKAAISQSLIPEEEQDTYTDISEASLQHDTPHSRINVNSSEVRNEESENKLDSITDFPSLENCNSLPEEFGGMPLSSVRQQQISHVLAKLSKCLNIQDTLSTLASTGSTEIEEFTTQKTQSAAISTPNFVNRPQVGISVTSVNSSERESLQGTPFVHSDTSVSSSHQTPPSQNSSGLSSAPDSSAAGNSSYTSGTSVGSHNQRRMSPKGGKSKVHFASFLTEISTSASQSLEGRISVRKMDLTPQNSPHVSLDASDGGTTKENVDGVTSSNTEEKGACLTALHIPSKNLYDLGSSDRPQGNNTESMLSRVALSPETSESPGTPRDFFSSNNGLPFHGYGAEVENNTSDKENECHDTVPISNSSGFVDVGDDDCTISQSSAIITDNRDQILGSTMKSDDRSPSSTLKASQDTQYRDIVDGGTVQTGATLSASEQYSKTSRTFDSNSISDDLENTKLNTFSSQKLVTNSQDKLHGNVESSKSDKLNSEQDNSSKQVFRQGHSRKGSYTLNQPSPVLLQAVSQDFTASNGVTNISRSVQRRLEMDAMTQNCNGQSDTVETSKKITQQNPNFTQGSNKITQQNISLHSSTEEEGKAEHIQRYLTQVQNHSEGRSPAVDHLNVQEPGIIPNPVDITEAVQSFTASLQTMEDMSEEQLLQIQTDHFNRLRTFLIEQQKQQLEELFVQQRREQLLLQEEITSFQEKIKDSQDLSNEHSPENNLAYALEEPSRPAMNISGIPASPPHGVQQKPFAYMSSPSLYFNPKDRDNNSDISTFSRTTPKQSLQFVNHSTPSPKNFKPVMRSPMKKPNIPVAGRLNIPPEAHYSELKPYFDRVSACVKGYLTRRLLKTEKVQEIIKTIKDTKQFAYSFQCETPIRNGQFSNQDRYLLDRIIAQLQSGLLDIHEIFFTIPVWERMSIIAQSRQLLEEKRIRESNATRSSVSSSQPRISAATLKAIERKRRAFEAEAAVFRGNTMLGEHRPRSAPPNEKCQRNAQQQALDLRALRPIQGQGTTSHSGNKSNREKTRPHTALGAPTKHQAVVRIKKPIVSGKTTTKPTVTKGNKSTTTVKGKTKPAGAWR